MNVEIVRIGDIGEIFDGPHATPTRKDEGKHFLNISSLSGGRLDLDHSDHVDEEDFVKWTRRVRPQENDLLFSYETRLGEAALMPDGVDAALGRRMALIRPNVDVVNPGFLLYAWLSPRFKEQIERRAIRGATVDRISLSELSRWEIRLPPLAAQKVVSEVLGSLDDKIAANRRVAARARRLASALWDSWSTSRPMVRLTDVVTPLLGGTPARSDDAQWDGGTPWASVKDITGADYGVILGTSETIVSGLDSPRRLKAHPEGTIFLSARGTVGVTARAAVSCAVNQSAYAFVPPADRSAVLKLALDSLMGKLNAEAHGSVFSTITMKTLDRAEIPDITSNDAEKRFSRIEILEDRVTAAMRENRILDAARDELLPLLMSGRITVKDAEKYVEDVV